MKKLSLFWRLYLSMSAAMLILAIILIAIMQTYFGYDGKRDFVNDVYQELKPVLIQSNKGKFNQRTVEAFASSSNFRIFIEPNLKAKKNNKNEYLGEHRKTSVFILPDGRLQAWIFLQSLPGYLVVEDYAEIEKGLFFNKMEGLTSEDYLENYAYELLILLTLIVMSVVVLMIAKAIEKPIEALQQAQLKFSSGKTDIRANEDVPSPVDGLAKNFNLMAEKIETQIKDNQVMTHAISHELRTPLTRMQFALGILQTKKTALTESEQALLGDLDTYIEDMDKLTKTILTLGNVQHQRLNTLSLVDADKFIQERISKLTKRDKNFSIELQSDSMLSILPMHFQLLVDNLVNNAQQYGDKMVSITSYIENGYFVLTVADDGLGITEDQSKKIFNAFARLDTSRSRETGGFGLGLAIVESIVRRYQGHIKVEPSSLGGAGFTCWLPLEEA